MLKLHGPRSIRWQMVTVVSLVSAIIIATFGWTLERHMRESQAEIGRAQTALTRRIARELDVRIGETITMLSAMAASYSATVPGGDDGMRTWLRDRPGARRILFDCGLFSARADGPVLAVGDAFSIAGNPVFRKWLDKPLTLAEPVVAPPFQIDTAAGRQTVLIVSAPVYDSSDHPVRTLGGCMNVRNRGFLGSLKDVTIGSTGHIFVTSWDGRLILHPDERLLMRPDIHPIPPGVLEQARAGLQAAVETIDNNGVPVLSSFVKLQSTGWVLGASTPLEDAYGTLNRVRRDSVIWLLAGILFAATVTWAMMRRFMAPIEALTATLDRIHVHGNDPLEPLPEHHGSREADCLASAFNRLFDRINRDRGRAALATSVYENAREGILVTDTDGRIVSVNRAFTLITGFEPDEVIGKTPALLKSGRHDHIFYRELWAGLKSTGTWRGEIWNRRKSGEIYPELLHIGVICGENGEPGHYLAIFSDITDLKSVENKLEMMATTDALTGLPNRVLLSDRLRQAIAQADRHGPGQHPGLAIATIDLDGFKLVNDTYGHPAGDRLLIEVSSRIGDHLRGGDTLARLGGDEFVVLLADIADHAAARDLLGDILDAVSVTYDIDGHRIAMTASIGVTLYPDDKTDADRLLRHADQAMYRAKSEGRRRIHFFDAEHDRAVQHHFRQVQRIREAIRKNELQLYYQPKVDLRHRRVVGAEALLRWQHPFQGMLHPHHFIDDMQDPEVQNDIGEWVIQETLTQMDVWRTGSGLWLPVSVNASAEQITRPDFVAFMTDQLARHPDLKAGSLEIEILETDALKDIGHVRRVLDACHAMGIGFAIDDFGTGYSSLSYLKNVPAGTLKIDKSFVLSVLNDPDSRAIIEGIVQLAKVFGRKVIAEGLESEGHIKALLDLGCELGQGFVIARPMPPAAIPDWVQQWEMKPPVQD